MTAFVRYPPAPDWQDDLAGREAEWDNPHIVIDEMAVPGIDPYDVPRPEYSGYLMAFLGISAILVTGIVLWFVTP
jgi:hypothetical protein